MGKVNNLEIKDDLILLKFNSEIYELNSIKKAIKDYKKVGKINVSNKKKENQSNYLVTIKPHNDTMAKDRIGFEFFNYVLGMMRN